MGCRCFFFLLPLFLPLLLSGQSAPYGIAGKSLPELRREADAGLLTVAPPALPGKRLFAGATVPLKKKRTQPVLPAIFHQRPAAIPGIYSYQELAFFCKLEVQLERRANVPIKFRLGDVLYVDYLEGKRDSY